MSRITLSFVISLIIALLGFSGCGGGDESIESLLDVRNPSVVNNISAYPSYKRVRLTWVQSTDTSIIGYNVYRSSANSGGFTLISSVGQMATPYFQDEGPDNNSDGIPDGLTNNITHFYKVTAFDKTGRETPLSLAAAVSAIPGQLPNNSANLAVSNVNVYGGRNEIYVSWDRLDHQNVFGYNVYRSVSTGNSGFELIALTPQNQNSFVDGGLSPFESYIYQIAPAVSEIDTITGDRLSTGLLEGRRTESHAARTKDNDSTVPKPPSSSPSSNPMQASKVMQNGREGVQIQFSRPTSNTDGTIIADNDDIVSGGYIIYRSSVLLSEYKIIGIIENPGSQPNVSFFDPWGTETHYYKVRIGDNFGNLSDASDIVSISSNVPPPTVKSLNATSGQGFGSIEIAWSESVSQGQGIDSYSVYRSESLNHGFAPIAHNVVDQDPDPNFFKYTDTSAALNIGTTYYYKVAAIKSSLESSLSAATAARPGPANGIRSLEGENAVKFDSYIAGATKIARTPPDQRPQYWPTHFDTQHIGLPTPFSGNGVLWIKPTKGPGEDITLGERIDLTWQVDIQALVGSEGTGGTISADVYMSSLDDNTTGQYRILIDDREIDRNRAPGQSEIIPFNGIQAEVNFKDSTFSTPLRPTRRLLGTLIFENINDYGNVNHPAGQGSNFAGTETVWMSVIHTGAGDLKLDNLYLVIH